VVGFVVFGSVYSFGTFFQPLSADLNASHAAISALFAAAGLGFYLFGPITGHLGDRFGPRVMTAVGALMIGTGFLVTASVHSVWLAYFTYGIGVGLGAAFAYLPCLAAVGGWFERLRTTALGFAAVGTGCGLLVMPTACAALIDRLGWRSTYVLMGILSAMLLGVSALTVRRSPVKAARDHRPISRVLCSVPFVALYVSWVLATTGLFVAFVYLPTFAHEHGASETAASALLSLIGAMSVPGRLCIGVLSRRIGVIAMFRMSVVLMASSCIIWLVTSAYGWLVVFAALLGLGYGIRIALVPAVLIELFGLGRLGSILGFFFTATGVASVLGPTLAGMIVDRTAGYTWAIIFALAVSVLGSLATVLIRADERYHQETA